MKKTKWLSSIDELLASKKSKLSQDDRKLLEVIREEIKSSNNESELIKIGIKIIEFLTIGSNYLDKL